MKSTKRNNKDLFDFPNKVLSQPQLIHPFPNDIHQLLASFMELSYFVLVFPYRIIYNSSIGQYETRTNLFHKIIFIIVWTLFLFQYVCVNVQLAMDTLKGSSLGVLRLLGGAGHLMNVLCFLFTMLYFRTKIVDLLNLMVIGCASSSSLSSQKVTSIVRVGEDNRAPMYDNEGGPSSYQQQFSIGKAITFKRIGIAWWFACLLMGIRCTAFIDRISGTKEFRNIQGERPSSYNFITKLASKSFETFMVSGWTPGRLALEASFIALDAAAEFHSFGAAFFGGMEVIVVVSLKFICSHFTNSLDNSKEFWKPSSHNVLSSFLIVRQTCRRINKIFGWLLFFSIMGEFPNLTFFVVYAYKDVDAPFEWSYRFGNVLVALILLAASSVVIELSKLKDWLHLEENPQRSAAGKGSFQKRIVLFELSLKRCAIFAHDFFQLSLPACVSILLGIMSNALILIQMDIASNDVTPH